MSEPRVSPERLNKMMHALPFIDPQSAGDDFLDVINDLRDARTALTAAQTDAAHWCEKYDGALGKLAAAERDARIADDKARETCTRLALTLTDRAREAESARDAAVALAEALRAALVTLRSRFGPPIDYADPVYQMLHDADAALAMTDAGALEALRERVRAEAFEEAEECANEQGFPIVAAALRALAGGRKGDGNG